MGQYLISVWHPEDYEVDFSSEDAQRRHAKVMAFNEELVSAGALAFAGGLMPRSSISTLRFSDGDVARSEGTFSSAPELMGGFWVIEAETDEAAQDWATKACQACEEILELRPFQG